MMGPDKPAIPGQYRFKLVRSHTHTCNSFGMHVYIHVPQAQVYTCTCTCSSKSCWKTVPLYNNFQAGTKVICTHLYLNFLHNTVYVQNSTIAGTDDGFVLQNHNLSIERWANVTEVVGVTQNKAGRDILWMRERERYVLHGNLGIVLYGCVHVCATEHLFCVWPFSNTESFFEDNMFTNNVQI